MSEPQQLKGHLDLLLLSVVSKGPCHGYAVIQRLREQSRGFFDLPEGTVYPALRRLEQAKLVSSAWRTVEGRRRRIYRLTGAGGKSLRARADEWESFRAAVTTVVGVPA